MLLKNINVEHNNKGQIALFVTLVVMFIMLMVGLSLSKMAVKQIKITRNAYQSVQAYCLADTGTENILYRIINDSAHPIDPCADYSPGETMISEPNFAGGSYQINLDSCSPSTVIKIFGVFEKTSRAIQISY